MGQTGFFSTVPNLQSDNAYTLQKMEVNRNILGAWKVLLRRILSICKSIFEQLTKLLKLVFKCFFAATPQNELKVAKKTLINLFNS